MASVPVIDLGAVRALGREHALADDDATVREWDAAMRTAGFAVVVNHGIDPGLIERAFGASRQFFTGRSAEDKKQFCFGPYGNDKGGFAPPGAESVGRTLSGSEGKPPADLVESYVLKARFWPDKERLAMHAPELVAEDGPMRQYFAGLTALMELLHRLSGKALGAGEDFFEPYYGSEASLSLRLAHYPSFEPPAVSASGTGQPVDETSGAQRYGAHCDYEGFTILAVEDEHDKCLEVFLNGKWEKVQCPKGALVVNVGELMTTWSGGRWASTLHRVVNAEHGKERFSLPFFTGPRRDAIVLPVGETDVSKGIRAHDHLMAQLQKSNV